MSTDVQTELRQAEIREVPISEINPAPYNPRVELTPDDPEYAQLERSIDTYGLVEPLVWNERSGHLVGGHQRFNVMRRKRVRTLPCIVVDLNDSDERGLNLALNKLEGSWDVPRLLEYLTDESISFTGFSEPEIEDIAWSLRDGVFRVALNPAQLAVVVEAIDLIRTNDSWARNPPRAVYGIAQWWRSEGAASVSPHPSPDQSADGRARERVEASDAE